MTCMMQNRQQPVTRWLGVKTQPFAPGTIAVMRPASAHLSSFVAACALLSCIVLSIGSTSAQQPVISGRPGVAQNRAVVNMRGLSILERIQHQTNHVAKALPLPQPRVATQ